MRDWDFQWTSFWVGTCWRRYSNLRLDKSWEFVYLPIWIQILTRMTNQETKLAKRLLTAVTHVQKSIIILIRFVDGIHEIRCKEKPWKWHIEPWTKKLQKRVMNVTRFNEKRQLPVWGNVFLTNTNKAFPGGKFSLLLNTCINCPMDISRGTKYL